MFFCKCWVGEGITNKNLFEQLFHLAAYFNIGKLKSTTDPDPKDVNSLEFHPIKREELEAAVVAKDDGKLLVLQVASAAAASAAAAAKTINTTKTKTKRHCATTSMAGTSSTVAGTSLRTWTLRARGGRTSWATSRSSSLT